MGESPLVVQRGGELADDEVAATQALERGLLRRIDARLAAEQRRLRIRVAELEAESERFTVHSDIERQDDKWIPEVQE